MSDKELTQKDSTPQGESPSVEQLGALMLAELEGVAYNPPKPQPVIIPSDWEAPKSNVVSISGGPVEARDWSPLQPLNAARCLPLFPLDVLPPVMKQSVQELSWRLQTPYDMAAAMAIGAMATALQQAHNIKVDTGWTEECGLFITCAAPSGMRKSAILKACTAAIERFEQLRIKAYERSRAEWTVKKARAAKDLKIAQDANPFDEEAAIAAQEVVYALDMDQPHEPQLTVEDTSAEELAHIMAKNNSCISVQSDEGKGLFGNILPGRYHKGTNKDDIYLKMSGGTLKVNRRGHEGKGEYLHIENVRGTIANMIQDKVLVKILGDEGLLESGFFFRFLLSFPEPTYGDRDMTKHPEVAGVQDSYDNTIMRVLQTPARKKDLISFTLSYEARSALEAYEIRNEPLNKSLRYEVMRGWMSKSAGAACKLAAILRAFAIPDNPSEVPITVQEIEAGITLVEYYREHFKSLLDQGLGREGTPNYEILLNWVKKDQKKRSKFKSREVVSYLKTTFKKTSDVDLAAEMLQDKGYLWIEASKGKEAVTYHVNPAAFLDTDSTKPKPRTLPEPFTGPVILVAPPVLEDTGMAVVEHESNPELEVV